jgi:hypothetical protein
MTGCAVSDDNAEQASTAQNQPSFREGRTLKSAAFLRFACHLPLPFPSPDVQRS